MRRRVLVSTGQAAGPNFRDRDGNVFIFADSQALNVRE